MRRYVQGSLLPVHAEALARQMMLAQSGPMDQGPKGDDAEDESAAGLLFGPTDQDREDDLDAPAIHAELDNDLEAEAEIAPLAVAAIEVEPIAEPSPAGR